MPAEALELNRRFTLPAQALGEGVQLEFVHWSLYSAIALDNAALPRHVECFNYTAGQVVTGAGGGAIAATKYHTNAQAIRTVPRPKTFTVFGVRVIMVPLEFASGSPVLDDGGDTTDATAGGRNVDQVDDLTFLQCMAARFSIGEKKYMEAPLYLLPANVGLSGLAANSVSNTNAAASAQRRVAVHSCGVAYEFGASRKPVIWNQQTFTFEYLCQWATNPTLNADRYLFTFLDGILGREVQ